MPGRGCPDSDLNYLAPPPGNFRRAFLRGRIDLSLGVGIDLSYGIRRVVRRNLSAVVFVRKQERSDCHASHQCRGEYDDD